MNNEGHPDRELMTYSAAEESARAGRVGLWTEHEPVPPWEWRKARRK